MARVIFGLLGLVSALFPERVCKTYERIAIENPDECTARASFIPAIRTEGLMFAVVSLVGGTAYAWLMNLVGAAGALAVLFPEQSLTLQARVVYEQPDTVEWKERFTTVVRWFGVLYLVLALGAFRKRRSDN